MKNQIINFVAIITMVISMQSCIGPAHLGSERTFVDRPRAAGEESVTATAKYNNSGSYAGNEAKNINASTTLDLTPFNRGVYIYQLKDRSGKVVESGKFQVSK